MHVVLVNKLVSCDRSHPNDDHTPETTIAAIVNPKPRGDACIDDATPGRGLPSSCMSDGSFLEMISTVVP
jgi:hypothetical protein